VSSRGKDTEYALQRKIDASQLQSIDSAAQLTNHDLAVGRLLGQGVEARLSANAQPPILPRLKVMETIYLQSRGYNDFEEY
jgi:hypothetical protein